MLQKRQGWRPVVLGNETGASEVFSRMVEESESKESLGPGKQVFWLVNTLMVLAGFLGVFLGVLAVWQLLNVERRGFNVPLTLWVTLGMPSLWLMVTAVLKTLAHLKANREHKYHIPILLQLVYKYLAPRRWMLVRNANNAVRRLYVGLLWRSFFLGQVLASGWMLGCLLGLGSCLMTQDVRFYWESTTEDVGSDVLEWVAGVLSFPWAWCLPDLAVSAEDIAKTRWLSYWRPQDVNVAGLPADAWWGFLLMTILVWGLLPRLFLVGFAYLREWFWVKAYPFNTPEHREFKRFLLSIDKVVDTSGPDDQAFMVSIGADLDFEVARHFALRQLRLSPDSVYKLGSFDDDQTLSKVREAIESDKKPVVYVEVWDTMPSGAKSSLQALQRLSQDRGLGNIPLVLMGRAPNYVPEESEVSPWSAFLTDQGLLEFDVYRYRQHAN